MAVTFPRQDTSAPVPRFTSFRQWEPVKSTKIDSAAKLVQHLLQSDNAPPPIIEGGRIQFPPIPAPAAGQQHPKTRKILIYQEFAFYSQLLLYVSRPHIFFFFLLFDCLSKILGLHGISAAAINGSQSYDQRARTIEKFKTDPTLRVLIFSKIGTVGLNLTEADTLILLVCLSSCNFNLF